ncbi:capsule assembly Wzi family protein [Telluribacter sp.]|uniref:capsule assembly Wzi family protein n=1 Tax=Telluribacter sp. TaxID=1978767 RepID=UPI002E11A6BF|nr:capsule assembly Wzi family protein [Telluribacter sp.]
MLFSRFVATAQPVGLQGYAQLGGYVSTGPNTPFWLRANQWGRVPNSTPASTALLGIHYDARFAPADSTTWAGRSSFSWGVGAEGVLNAGPDPQRLLPEAYAKVQWRSVELWVGRRREVFGIMDTTLTSGSYSWSGNSLPIPKIQLRINDYLSLPFLNNFIGIKGSFSHGWYNVPYIQKVLLHQKSLSGRIGSPEGPFHFYLGVNHHVLWGGEAEYLTNNPLAVNGKLTRSFRDFLWGVLLGKTPKAFRTDRYTNFDGENRVGNHVGHYDLAVDYRLTDGTLMLYHQHAFEDASGLVFKNSIDGLTGLSWKPKFYPDYKPFVLVKGAVLEFLHTTDQTAPTFVVSGSRFMGNDNYFNHAQYREGWTYLGKALGTPLLAPRAEIREEIGLTGESFPNNRVLAYHAGVEALVANLVTVRAKVSYSRNFGTHNRPFEISVKQVSSLLGFELPIFNWGNTRLTGQIAYDRGDLYPPALGGYLGIRTTGWNSRPADILHRLPF